jgi:hypothetical protein
MRSQFPIILLRPIRNKLKWLLWSWLIKGDEKSNLKSFIINGDVKDEFGVMNMENKLSGYVFLLDNENKIIWKSSGKSTQSEIDCFKKILSKYSEN